jgi:hypothetical protein
MIGVSLSLKYLEASLSSPHRVRPEAFYHHFPLGLVLPEVTKQLFLSGIIPYYPL